MALVVSETSAGTRATMAYTLPAWPTIPAHDAPVILAGALGGPAVEYLITPARNGLTLGATSVTASAGQLYSQVFTRGFTGGWVGGIYPAIAACPTYLCIGPAYHFYASYTGVAGGVVLASLTETAISYGAETCNAQMAVNSATPGKFLKVHSSWKPWGPGVGVFAFRNVIAMAGLRVFCTPCTDFIEAATGRSNNLTQISGDFAGNVGAACITAPIHQLYNFLVSTPELQVTSAAAKRARMVQFLREQYTETRDGRTRLSKTVPRDLFMRVMYVAVGYTMYSSLERALVKNWPE